MSEMIHAIVLALLQGVTEFLPISSSGHLAFFPHLFGWPDQGLAFDVAVHIGTLAAVVLYFRDELSKLLGDWFRSLTGGPSTPYSRLAWYVALGTIPVGLVGLVFGDLIEKWLRDPVPIAIATIAFGLLLWWADANGTRERDEHEMNWRDMLVIGAAQALALIPGTSRSGITITAGLAMGLTRPAAARFSFLLSIPVIILAGGWETKKLIASSEPVQWGFLGVAAVVSAITAYLCIKWFLTFLERFSLMPFVIYRLLLGGVLLAMFW